MKHASYLHCQKYFQSERSNILGSTLVLLPSRSRAKYHLIKSLRHESDNKLNVLEPNDNLTSHLYPKS